MTDNHSFPTIEEGRKMLHSVSQESIDALLKNKLQFDSDYYTIVDLAKMDEESKSEGHGFEEGADKPQKENTQLKEEQSV